MNRGDAQPVSVDGSRMTSGPHSTVGRSAVPVAGSFWNTRVLMSMSPSDVITPVFLNVSTLKVMLPTPLAGIPETTLPGLRKACSGLDTARLPAP